MKPLCIPAVVLAASLGVAAGSEVTPGPARSVTGPGVAAPDHSTASASVCGSMSLTAEERVALIVAEQRDADLGDLKAGFFMDDHDVMLVVGTVVIVVLIALLL